MLSKLKYFIFLITVLFIFSSCGVSKHMKADELLLAKNELKINKLDNSSTPTDSLRGSRSHKIELNKSDIEGLIEQTPNSKFLFTRLGMRIYCLSVPEKDSWFQRFLRKNGQAPVIYNEEKTYISVEKMKRYLFSKGIFESKISYTSTPIGNKMYVVYNINAAKRYKINTIEWYSGDEKIMNELSDWKPYTLIKSEHYYDQDILSKERENLVRFFRNKGYYAFGRDLITFNIDTNLRTNHLNITALIEQPEQIENDTTPKDRSFEKFYIKDIYINIDNSYSLNSQNSSLDTTNLSVYRRADKKTNNYTFSYRNEIPIRPQVIDRSMFFDQNDMFQLRKLEQTYTGLENLQNFQLIEINFVPSVDSNLTQPLLDAHIRLLTTKKHSFSTAFEVSNTAADVDTNVGNFGFEWSLAYRNKNLFRGAEIFEIKSRLAFQFPKDIFRKSDVPKRILTTFEAGLDANLELPQFLFPFFSGWFRRDLRPRTTINIGYNIQYRDYFNRSSIMAGFGYRWRNGNRNMHQLLPIELNLVKINVQDTAFYQYLSDERLKYKYSSHLIFASRYNYTYSGQTSYNQRDFSYFSFSLESAGNLLYFIDKVSGTQKNEDGIYEKMGVPYSQYLRTTIELKRYIPISSLSTFVMRFYSGIGVPYANSLSLPYEKSFFAGGTTSLRAWRMRSLGPGSSNPESGNPYERIGDLSIIANIEARFPLFSIIEGAFFVDAGNIWLLRKSDVFPDGEFLINKFYKDLAIGGGFGIRVNIFISTFRIDFAMPFYNPAIPENNKWVFNKWKWSQLVVNWGIGFPF